MHYVLKLRLCYEADSVSMALHILLSVCTRKSDDQFLGEFDMQTKSGLSFPNEERTDESVAPTAKRSMFQSGSSAHAKRGNFKLSNLYCY